MATSQEREAVWRQFLLQASVSIHRVVLSHLVSLLYHKQIWYGDQTCPIWEAGTRFDDQQRFRLRDVLIVNSVRSLAAVTQAERKDRYRR